ncbi:hypothetical protein KP003_09900 [Geomonas nitrogeniifigens]|uniref:Uncharacterized protein n=1 Tax=Geomonas diazotrophica TaxID=2843197 RepID=A0ABX8JSE1_9BACT|nr:hypothetical protein [Geomonas nitrogeniifigens]QWV99507.1 hypothetical protein KP005_09600 [Geomonas nitrogeniifigens]QXE88682.1 hypothetical protein KP003_09900 [Geomonas nitrogeniifigens]
MWTGGREGKSAPLQTVQDDLQYARQKTWDTRKALDDVRFANQADLPRAYRAFREEVNTMTDAGMRLVQHANGMHYQGNAYIVEAEQSAGQCRYPRLSRSARMPRMELGDAFEPIDEQAQQVQRAYRSFQFDILAIERYLSREMTEKGVRDMEIFMRRSEVNGDSLLYALEAELSVVERAKRAYNETAQGKEGLNP